MRIYGYKVKPSLTSASCTYMSQVILFQVFLTLQFAFKQMGKKDGEQEESELHLKRHSPAEWSQ